MKITAKELARQLNLSETAVSMALNNKPGVSITTRRKVINAAEKAGYDFERIKNKKEKRGSIYFISYRTSNAILSYSPIFDELLDGIVNECEKKEYPVRMIQVYEKSDNLERILEDLRVSDCCGIILVGTEMRPTILKEFLRLKMPLTLLDSYFDTQPCNSVLINNFQGAYDATNFLIGIYRVQPGYLKSNYSIPNFEERTRGFYKALLDNGMSRSRSIIQELTPAIDAAMGDMLELIDHKEPLARCYFADNDMIAIGALKALRLRGYRIPEDVAIIGFDNIPEAHIVEPSLSTMDVPRFYIGRVAAKNLMEQIESKVTHLTKTEIATSLTRRFST